MRRRKAVLDFDTLMRRLMSPYWCVAKIYQKDDYEFVPKLLRRSDQ